MKKKIIIIVSFLVLLIVIALILCLKFISFGTTTYKMPNSEVTLEIPKLSIFKEECCMFSASFKTFRSKSIIKKELDKIINKYEKITCNSRTVFYSKENDITITEYGVESGFIMNTFYITYDKGKNSNEECNAITDSTKIEYRFLPPVATDFVPKIKKEYQYLNKNGNKYDVYTDCTACIEIKKGMGYYDPLDMMLWSRYISMQDFIDYLEYEVKNSNATKKVYEDGGSVLYKTKDFGFLKCNTIDGNQDVYISIEELDYKEDYCK